MNEKLDLTVLRKIAEAATSGPWEHQPYGEQNQNGDHFGGWLLDSDGEFVVSEVSDMDGAHMAAFDPPTVLALLSRLEQAERSCRLLGTIIERDGKNLVELTNSQDIITEDGDGDWEVVWERAQEMKVRLEQAEQRVALLESGIVAGIVNTSVFTAKAIGADVSSVSESILNMGYPALREQLEQTERLLERVRSEAQELADMNEPAGENFLSILDGEQDG